MPTFPNVAVLLLLLHLLLYGRVTAATWCVARSDATQDALQTALDYACGAGADCEPIQQTGLCFLPNNIQAHASYAFNSYYMRASMAPVSCDFSGTATVAKTDPSYGSCVYPASPSTAGGTGTTISTSGNAPPPPPLNVTPIDGSGGALTPADMVPTLANPPASEAYLGLYRSRLLYMDMMLIAVSWMYS